MIVSTSFECNDSCNETLLQVNIGSSNGLVPPHNKPLPEPLLTQTYGVTQPRGRVLFNLRHVKT